MPVNDTTTNRGYEKPNSANLLIDDVSRLRTALDQIDTDMVTKAGLASPAFTGTPTAPTATAGTNTTQLATTAFVQGQGFITAAGAPVTSVASKTGAVTLVVGDVSGAAPLASPAFTGTPTAPTPVTSDNTTKVATTAYVKAQGYIGLDSPAFTGTPTAPTATAGTNTTQLATTGFVQTAVAGYGLLDGAQVWTKGQRGEVTALVDGATITPNFADSNNFSVTLAGNRILANPTNLVAGQSGAIVVTQDGSGGKTLAYGNSWKFPGGTAPTLTTAANAVDVLVYYVESATRITARLISDVK